MQRREYLATACLLRSLYARSLARLMHLMPLLSLSPSPRCVDQPAPQAAGMGVAALFVRRLDSSKYHSVRALPRRLPHPVRDGGVRGQVLELVLIASKTPEHASEDGSHELPHAGDDERPTTSA